MDTRPRAGDRIDENELHALVDGRLADDEAARLRQSLAASPADRAAVEAWQSQREAIRNAFPAGPPGEMPPSLLAAAQRAQELRDTAGRWWRWGGMAASLLLAFGLGWGVNARFGSYDTHYESAAQSARHFAQQASVAYAVFQPEVKHPVEVTAAQQEHLVQWLSKRLGRPLKVPVLTAQGYELMGGRLLPGDGGARAQFMYQNPAGQRLTLYLGAIKGAGPETHETSFTFLADGPVPGFYWVDDGFGCALSGQLSRSELYELAKTVYSQIS